MRHRLVVIQVILADIANSQRYP